MKRRALPRGAWCAALCLLAALAPLALSRAHEARAQEAPEPWTTGDVIDEHIDEEAQYSLMRMLSGDDEAAAADASAILSAIKGGDLEGVYQADRGVPAKRAQTAGTGWWLIVPQGSDAVCYVGTAGETPMIVYRKGAPEPKGRLDAAMREAWKSCGIAAAAPRPYRETIRKPTPPAEEGEGDGGAIVVVTVLSNNGPLAGATVYVLSSGPGQKGTTDAEGNVALGPVPPGAVNIGVQAPDSCLDADGKRQSDSHQDEIKEGTARTGWDVTFQCAGASPPSDPAPTPEEPPPGAGAATGE